MPQQEQPPIPSILSFLICDQIITEQGSGKKSLIGLFDRVFVNQLPAVHPVLWAFAKLTDAEGLYTFRIEIVKLESDKPIGRAVTPEATIGSQLDSVDMVMRFPMVPFEELGTYEFQLYANDVWVGRTKLTVEMAAGGP